jgi:hypothetical protein
MISDVLHAIYASVKHTVGVVQLLINGFGVIDTV